MALGPALATAILGFLLCLTGTPPSPAQVAAFCRLLFISCLVALGKTQKAVDLGMHLIGRPSASTPTGQLQTISKHHPTTSTNDTLKQQVQQTPGPCQSNSCSVVWVTAQLIIRSSWWSQSVLPAHPLVGKSLTLMCQQQSKLSYNRRVYTVHMGGRMHLDCPA